MAKQEDRKLPKSLGIQTVSVEYGPITRRQPPGKPRPAVDPRPDKGHAEIERNPASWWRHSQQQQYIARLLLRETKPVFEALVAWHKEGTEEEFADLGTRILALFDAVAFHLGMALELAAKGAIAKRTGKAPPMRRNAHDLPSLLRRAGLDLSPAEEEVAMRLTAAVRWWSRYPVPKDGEVYVQSFTDGTRKWSPEAEVALVESLLGRLGAVGDSAPLA